jgi:hypothetical protein
MGAARRRGCLGVPFALWLPGCYLAFALYAWIDFTRTNHDGLANVGLFLVTFPVTIADLILSAMTGRQDVLMPHGHGYIGDHALYYLPAALVTAALFGLAGRAIDRLVAKLPED